MTHLSCQGQIQEITPEVAFIWADSMLVSILDIVSDLHWAQTFAMPGRSIGYFLNQMDICVQELNANRPIIDDARILHAINEILPQLEGIATTAGEIRAWQKQHVPRRTITAHNKATRASGPREPAWQAQAEFKELLAEFSLHFSLYLDALLEFVPILQVNLPADNATYSEQLEQVQEQIQHFRRILTLGYIEAGRIAAAEAGYLPPD